MDNGKRVTNALGGQLRIEEDNGRIVVVDLATGQHIMLIGADLTGQVIIKIAKVGYDVFTATNDQLVFNSGQDILKVASIVTGSISVSFPVHNSGASSYIDGSDANATTLTMPHGLTGIPALFPHILDNSSSTYQPIASKSICDVLNGGGLYAGPFSFGLSTWSIWADNTNVYVTANRNYAVTAASNSVAAQSGSANFKVYCMQETAN